ncbi:hypothetical protein HC891_22585 [Candidatus Gracilibacteria bacterium]|nr:hypothetical protein [Candidatus Gracilibacteria bacterium]
MNEALWMATLHDPNQKDPAHDPEQDDDEEETVPELDDFNEDEIDDIFRQLQGTHLEP